MTAPQPPRRGGRPWPTFLRPMLLAVTGFRDQRNRVTYLPWSDVELGLVGWEVLPDRSTRQLSIVVYVIPNTDGESLEIRCHVATEEPNPETDPLLGTVTIPPEMLGIEPIE